MISNLIKILSGCKMALVESFVKYLEGIIYYNVTRILDGKLGFCFQFD